MEWPGIGTSLHGKDERRCRRKDSAPSFLLLPTMGEEAPVEVSSPCQVWKRKMAVNATPLWRTLLGGIEYDRIYFTKKKTKIWKFYTK